MAGYRWSGKRVAELLEEFSDNQKNFKTKPSGRFIPVSKSFKVSSNGYFYIQGAYGGWKLEYNLPYSTGVTDVSPYGFCPSGKLADYMLALGPAGLKAKFNQLQKQYKARMKAELDRERKRV